MENMKKVWSVLLKCICFAFCMGLVIAGKRSVDYQGLGTMLAGLCGILILLYAYNEKYR